MLYFVDLIKEIFSSLIFLDISFYNLFLRLISRELILRDDVICRRVSELLLIRRRDS